MKLKARLRLVFGLILAAILAWLPFEDTQPAWSLLLAAALNAVLAVYWLSQMSLAPLWMPGLGALLGAAVPLMAIILMLVKTGLHGHSAPDFTWQDLSSVLQSAPGWLLGGLLLGIGAALQHAASRGTRR